MDIDFPSKDKKRARRRVNNRRMKAVAEALGRDPKYADHLATCSCHMCGNPRKLWKQRTMQELRADEAMAGK